MKRTRKNAPLNSLKDNESRLNLRMTKTEAALCKARAKELGISINSFVRNSVLKACADI